VGLVLWLSVLKSGVHATLAGVALGLVIPLAPAVSPAGQVPSARLERALHPWVAFGILPLFALANTGLPLDAVDARLVSHPVTLGVACGLLFGKLSGVFGFTWLAVRFNVAALPEQVSWRQLFGVALLTGIGFTMSLFIGSLAFPTDTLHGEVRFGVLAGSTVAAIAGALLLRFSSARG
jgi:NhaA family Na+:H+ antiporter